ncbi:hypothetical protein RCL1_000331 [Eukaryota sp. TZLM3-RCL]
MGEIRITIFVCQEAVEAPILNNIDIPKVDFRNDALRLLGAYIGFNDKGKELLDSLLDSFENEFNTVTDFNISKQLNFTFLRCCYSSKFKHIFRSCPPSTGLHVAQRYNVLSHVCC